MAYSPESYATHTYHMFVYKHDFSALLLSCTGKTQGAPADTFWKNTNLSNNYQKASHTKAGIERIVTEMLKMSGSYALILYDRNRNI